MLMSHSVAHDILPASLSKSDNALVSIRRSSSRMSATLTLGLLQGSPSSV
jgi:hypothetical protein